jgi:D-methionine transport system ATP-binding protein
MYFMTQQSDFIQFSNVSKKYPGLTYPALDHINLALPKGKVIGIIGRSGAGKSTLMRCLNGLEQPDQGQITLDGIDLIRATGTQKQELLRSIGTVFQTFNLLARRTVYQNIALPMEWIGKVDQEAIFRLCQLVGIKDKVNHYPAALSGGQRQRVAIARALAINPKLLLCDEFTSALDPETTLEILALLRQLNQNLDLSILMITHDMSVVREICDVVYVMDQGKIIESGTIEQILTHPQHGVTKSLLSSLFTKDLPHKLAENLSTAPIENGEVIIRLIFSGKSAQRPIIADLIKQHDIAVNIIVGSLDHIRETAFGSLIIMLPFSQADLTTALNHFAQNEVSAEIVGYIRRTS